MPSDAERFRFVAEHRLTLHTDGGDYLVHWCRTAGPGGPPKFYPVSNGATAEEAVDEFRSAGDLGTVGDGARDVAATIAPGPVEDERA